MAGSTLVSETPILDLLEPLPKARKQKPIHAFAYSLLAVTVFGIITDNYPLIVFYVSFLLVLLLVIATHEFGHLTAGWLAGLSFVGVSVGSFCLARDKSRLRVQFKRSPLWGQARMALVRLPNARKKLIALVIGGPLANLTCGIGALALAPTLSDHLGELESAMYGLFAYLSLLFFFTGLFPKLGNGYANDALLLKMLLTSRRDVKQLLASYALALQRRNGVDEINMNLRWAKLTYGLGTASQRQYFANWSSYRAQIDTNPAEAAKFLEKCLVSSATLTPEQRDHLVLEAAYFTAEHRGDSHKADTWLKRVSDPKKLHTLALLRVRVAILSSSSNHTDALQACDAGLLYLRQLSATTWARATESTWQAWRSKLEQKQTLAPVS